MNRDDYATEADFAKVIAPLEESYTNALFYALYKNAGNLQAWYNEANKVPETWAGKMGRLAPGAPSPWAQVGEIVIVGLVNREFPDWYPIGLPIGSETRLATEDSIVHIDVKTHKELDSDLDRTQDVRPEQISADESDSFVEDSIGRLGDVPPRLPPYYEFGPNLLKVTITTFVICVYVVDETHQYLTRLQLLTVPNGVLRAVQDYRDCFRAGKDGRAAHRYRVRLEPLYAHEQWRWREIRFEPQGYVITR